MPGSNPKALQTLDDSAHVTGLPKLKKIREREHAKPVDRTFLDGIDCFAELLCVEGIGSALTGVHAI